MNLKLPLPALLLSLSCAALHGQEYDIVFHRPLKVGAHGKYDGSMQLDNSQKVSVNERDAGSKTSTTKGTLKGQLEVTAVTSTGEEKDIKLTIESWTLENDGADDHSLKAGDVVEGHAGTPPRFTVNGKEVTPAVTMALVTYFGLKNNDNPSMDDAVFGPGKKVKVGDEWPINSEAAANDLGKQMGSAFTKDMVKGSTKVVAVTQDAKNPALQLAGKIHVTGHDLSFPGMPPGVKAEKLELEANLSGDLPVDTTAPQGPSNLEMNMTFIGGGEMNQNGQTFKLHIDVASKRSKKEKVDWEGAGKLSGS